MIEYFLILIMRILTGAVGRTQGFNFEPIEQRIYYANHSSHLDTLVIWGLLPKAQRHRVRPVAAKDYWWSSAWRRYLAEKVFRAIPVARQAKTPGDEPLRDLEEALANGDSLIFYPEGTRGSGQTIQPFKSGLYHLAVKYPAVTLVPVYIENLNRVLPKGEILPVPIICTVTFGAGFTLQPGEGKTGFLTKAQSALEALAT